MRYAGIDVGAERHVVAVVAERVELVVAPTSFGEDAEGYAKLLELLGAADDVLIAMEATGHYWQNLFAVLVGRGFKVALLNPLTTRRFAQAGLLRAKTDAIDARSIAEMISLKRPALRAPPDELTIELRERVRLRDRLLQDLTDRVRQLHRVIDLSFPEFARHVSDLSTLRATTILSAFPTARTLAIASVRAVAQIVYDRKHKVGAELARTLIETAKRSIGQHHTPIFAQEVKYYCEDIQILRARIQQLDRDLEQDVVGHDVASLLTTIDGIGPSTAARLVAELGDPGQWKSPDAIAAHLGVVPQLKHSGKSAPLHAGTGLGDGRLRRALWMPVMCAVRCNTWLKQHYERLLARGKPFKVVMIACMRKLVAAIYSVAKNRRPFVPRVTLPAAGNVT